MEVCQVHSSLALDRMGVLGHSVDLGAGIRGRKVEVALAFEGEHEVNRVEVVSVLLPEQIFCDNK